MRIVDLDCDDLSAVEQCAQLLIDGFRDTGCSDWLESKAALEEVRDSLAADRISRIAVDDHGTVLGWIGGIRTYAGNAWEMHPLVVRRDRQRQGIGRALVEDLEERVREEGAWTLWLGTDDENERTSIGGIDLYPEPLRAAAELRNRFDHPFSFYERLGYVVVGVLPDANGFGKPDIFMAKRLRSIDDPPAAGPDDASEAGASSLRGASHT